MKYIAAYLLAQSFGKTQPTQDDVAAVLKAAGVSIDNEVLAAQIAKLEGKTTEELIQEGSAKIATVAGGPAPAAGAAAPAAVVEEKKEEEAAVEVNLGDMFDW